MRSRKARRLTKAELRAMGVTPGRLATRYGPGGKRATVRQVVAEASRARMDPRPLQDLATKGPVSEWLASRLGGHAGYLPVSVIEWYRERTLSGEPRS